MSVPILFPATTLFSAPVCCEQDAPINVAGDQVAFQGVGNAVAVRADDVVLGDVDAHPFHLNAHTGRAAGVGADQVAGDAVVVAHVDAGSGQVDVMRCCR